MKVIIQHKIYDLSWVYAMSPLRHNGPDGSWIFTMNFINVREPEEIYLDDAESQYFISLGTPDIEYGEKLKIYYPLREAIKIPFRKLAETNSKDLYQKILNAWIESKEENPRLPSFNIE